MFLTIIIMVISIVVGKLIPCMSRSKLELQIKSTTIPAVWSRCKNNPSTGTTIGPT